jgi:hypothetical protein
MVEKNTPQAMDQAQQGAQSQNASPDKEDPCSAEEARPGQQMQCAGSEPIDSPDALSASKAMPDIDDEGDDASMAKARKASGATPDQRAGDTEKPPGA